MRLRLESILPAVLLCAAPVMVQAAASRGATSAPPRVDRVANTPAVAGDADAAFDDGDSELMAQLAGDLPDDGDSGPMLAAGDPGMHGGMAGVDGMGMHGRRGAGGPMGVMAHGGMGGPGGTHAHWGMMAARLKLTDAQREKIHGIFEAQARRGIQERADLQLAMLDLHHLIHADSPSANAIDAQVDKVARLHATLTKQRIASMLEAHAVLTPEQRDELKRGPVGGGGRWGGRDEDESDDAPRGNGR